MKKPFVIALGLSSLLVASTALAQEASVTDEKDASVSSFATLDRGDSQSKLGLNASMTFLDSSEAGTALRFDLHGQYVHEKGYGVYGSLPLSHYSADMGGLGGGDFSEFALGNLEVGGIYNHKLSSKMTLTGRAGLVLPTADDDEGILANVANMLPRMTDFVSMMPETTVARASASLSGKEGQFFYRADAGLDVPVDTPEGSDLDPLVRLNLGVGINTGPVALMGELATVGTTGDVDDNQDRFLHTAALTAALTSNKKFTPTLSVIVPVNDDISNTFDASVVLGVQGRLP